MLTEYFFPKVDFYDSQSFKRILIILDGSPIYIFPTSLSLSLDIMQEEHKNLRGDVVELLKSFKGGTLSLEMPGSTYAEDYFSNFETLTEFFVLLEEQDIKKLYMDKITCSLQNFEVETDDPLLTSKMDFRVFSVERADIKKKEIDFSPLYSPGEVYYIKVKDDPTSLSLIYENEVKRDTVITLNYVTSLKSGTKLRHEQKRMDESGTWLFVQDGVEPSTLQVSARLYDVVDHEYGKVKRKGSRTYIKNTYSKEESLKALLSLLNIQKKVISRTGAKGELPAEVYLKSTLLEGISPYSYTFILTKLDYEVKDSYIEVQLEFFERREENPKIKPYTPKNKRFLNKVDSSFTLKSLSKGELDKDGEKRAIIYLNK